MHWIIRFTKTLDPVNNTCNNFLNNKQWHHKPYDMSCVNLFIFPLSEWIFGFLSAWRTRHTDWKHIQDHVSDEYWPCVEFWAFCDCCASFCKDVAFGWLTGATTGLCSPPPGCKMQMPYVKLDALDLYASQYEIHNYRSFVNTEQMGEAGDINPF